MSRASTTAENQALSGLTGTLTGGVNVVADVALAVGDPGTSGANENANSGGYARQAASWNTPSGGTMTNSGAMTFSTGGTVAVNYFFTASSATYGAGTVGIGGALTSAVTASTITVAAGAITLSAS